ncbi:MAG: amino acid adenylation domain-containing protein, partial [Pseudomonadota bacterium]
MVKNMFEVINTLSDAGIFVFVEDGKLKTRSDANVITPDIVTLIKANKDDLIAYLSKAEQAGASEHDGQAPQQVIVARHQDSARLSFGQQRLWLLDQIDGGSAHYNMPGALRLRGALNLDALTRALNSILARHQSLRTCFAVDADGQASQHVQPLRDIAVPISDLTQQSPADQQIQVAHLMAQEASRVFDLSADLMLRSHLIKLAPQEHILLVTMHHIASDGWSMAILVTEFSALYSAYSQGYDNPLPDLEIQYADYAHWQRDWLQGEVLEQQLGYWTTQLANLPAVHSLPLDHARPQLQRFAGQTRTSRIDADTCKRLNALCQSSGATLFMGLHATFSALLARYSNETDIVVGSPIANREQAEVAGLIGFFSNTLVLRSDLSANPSFMQLLEQSKGVLFDAYAHQQVPFEQIVERLQPQRSQSHSPLFQVMMVLQNNEEGSLELPGLTLSLVEQENTTAKFDLLLSMIEDAQGMELSWEFNTDLFEARTIERMASHFERLLKACLATPGESVFKAPLQDQTERAQQARWNAMPAGQGSERCMHELFEQQAATHPDAIALAFEGQQLSFKQLNEQANQLAHYLRAERQVATDSLVGICMERSIEMIVAILGILKAGAAYVPLDPDYPPARLSYMQSNAALGTVLTQTHVLARTPIAPEHALCIDADGVLQALRAQAPVNISAASIGLHAQHLAYVIYTSGSTGQPKAVEQTHRTIANLVQALAHDDAIDQPLRTLQFASPSFDVSVQEIATAWHTGSTLILISQESKRDLVSLPNILRDSQVERAFLPPAVLHWLVDTLQEQHITLPALKEIFAAGEALLPSPALSRFMESHPHCQLWNHYGPTETHVATRYRINSSDRHIPIGTLVAGLQAYILNAELVAAPHGIAGELHIGGAGLARGYLNHPTLTAEKFIANPFHDPSDPHSGAVLYKTGDLVRWLPDGNLDYLGRIDQQVKIRGFRIELGEIESALNSHPDIKDAIVLVKDSAGSEKRLVAYIVSASIGAETEQISALRQHLGQTLPDYMVPAAFVFLDSIPLTQNGKVDRKALPEPDASDLHAAYVAPRTSMEETLCALWQDVLGVARVGITDNFFQLGGHSLSATRLAAKINHHFQVKLPLKALFIAQNLEQLAQAISALDNGDELHALTPVPRHQDMLASFAQQRLWLIDQIDGGSAHYNMPGALHLRGALELAALERAVAAILERHESLRTCFKAGADGQVLQVIQAPRSTAIAVPLSDLSHLPKGEQESQVQACLSDEASQAFDLSGDLMLRARVLKLAHDEHLLLVTMHHIASDGWSMAILINEFSALYGAFAQGQDNPLPALEIQYADYAHWQRQWLQGDALERQLDYWSAQLKNLPSVHGLPLDHARPQMQSFNGASLHHRIDGATVTALKQLCQDAGATLFMGLHAAFSVLLSRYSNETDIVIGSPIANREQAEVAGLIGFFVNTLVLRSDLSGAPGFATLLAQSKTMLLDAYAHQQVPFEQLVERLQPQRSLSHSPLFQVMLVLQNNEEGELSLPGLTLSLMEQESAIAKYDLTLSVADTPDGLVLDWEYNTDLFESASIARMAGHFACLLGALTAAPHESVFKADMLGLAERQQLLGWSAETGDFPVQQCVHELFEQQAAQHPHAIALVYEQEQLSYAELNHKANQLAHYLRAHKRAAPDSLVGLCVERSVDMLVGILGILKAGGAYVPLDPTLPQARLAYMLEDADLATVITHRELQSKHGIGGAQALCLDDPATQAQLAAQPGTDIPVADTGLTPANLAYVIYTSGSTGKPKGALLEHRNVTRLFAATDANFGFGPADTWTMFHSYGFDFSVWEIWGALCYGGKLVIVPYLVSRTPELFHALLVEQRVTVLNQTPSAFMQLIAANAAAAPSAQLNLKYVIFGGEALNEAALQPWFAKHGQSQPQLINMYGITETTVHVTYQLLQSDQAHSPNAIGRPIADLGVYLLDAGLKLAPIGVAGELHVSGAGLARGYLNRPELTAERFIDHPYSKRAGARLYKSGDLARYLPDGSIAYLGRIDSQVKIRGFRIELGEIESALTSHPQVKESLVLATESVSGDKRLVAYVIGQGVPETGTFDADAILIAALRQHLAQTLPDYMIPAAFVVLDQMPLTPNGKVDHKALPAPDMAQSQSEYVAPRTATESRLCALWQEVLDIERVGITDNFFQLGGHSLSATRLV